MSYWNREHSSSASDGYNDLVGKLRRARCNCGRLDGGQLIQRHTEGCAKVEASRGWDRFIDRISGGQVSEYQP